MAGTKDDSPWNKNTRPASLKNSSVDPWMSGEPARVGDGVETLSGTVGDEGRHIDRGDVAFPPGRVELVGTPTSTVTPPHADAASSARPPRTRTARAPHTYGSVEPLVA